MRVRATDDPTIKQGCRGIGGVDGVDHHVNLRSTPSQFNRRCGTITPGNHRPAN